MRVLRAHSRPSSRFELVPLHPPISLVPFFLPLSPLYPLLPRGVDEKVSTLLVDTLRNPWSDRFTVKRDRKAALLSSDRAILGEIRHRLGSMYSR